MHVSLYSDSKVSKPCGWLMLSRSRLLLYGTAKWYMCRPLHMFPVTIKHGNVPEIEFLHYYCNGDALRCQVRVLFIPLHPVPIHTVFMRKLVALHTPWRVKRTKIAILGRPWCKGRILKVILTRYMNNNLISRFTPVRFSFHRLAQSGHFMELNNK